MYLLFYDFLSVQLVVPIYPLQFFSWYVVFNHIHQPYVRLNILQSARVCYIPMVTANARCFMVYGSIW